MKSRIIRCRIRNRVSFSPSPVHPAFPANPVFVESREVRHLKEIPASTRHIRFDDVVETEVFSADGARTLLTPAFNESIYLVVHDLDQIDALDANIWAPVEVAQHLAGKVWVFKTVYQNRAKIA